MYVFPRFSTYSVILYTVDYIYMARYQSKGWQKCIRNSFTIFALIARERGKRWYMKGTKRLNVWAACPPMYNLYLSCHIHWVQPPIELNTLYTVGDRRLPNPDSTQTIIKIYELVFGSLPFVVVSEDVLVESFQHQACHSSFQSGHLSPSEPL